MKHTSPYRRGVSADLARGVHGPYRGIVILVFVEVVIMLALCVLCLVGLISAEDTRSQILFGVFFLASFLTVALLKMGLFQRLDRLAILDALEEIRDESRA